MQYALKIPPSSVLKVSIARQISRFVGALSMLKGTAQLFGDKISPPLGSRLVDTL
jgi:hypothetical protein